MINLDSYEGGIIMGLMNFLDKVLEKCEEYTPQVMDYVQTAIEKNEEREQKEEQKVEKYKEEYSHLSNTELKNKLDEESGLRRKAIVLLLQERHQKNAENRQEIQEYKETYYQLSDMALVLELKKLEHKMTGYGNIPGQQLSEESVNKRKAIIVALLKERGYSG